MLIDPSGKKINLNVEDWSSAIIQNEFSAMTDLAGFIYSTYKGTVRKFECEGTLYGDNLNKNARYLESISFDDVVEISLDIKSDKCDFINGVEYFDTETVEGYISIDSLKIDKEGYEARPYKMSGFFFLKTEFETHTINSYFNMGAVSGSGLTFQNETISLSIIDAGWQSGGLLVNTAGGITFTLKPTDLLDCIPIAEVIDSGNNVYKIQLLTYTPAGNLIDISYVILNRGGFKLETNVKWSISASGASAMYTKISTGLKQITTGPAGTSITFVAAGVAILSNRDDLTVGTTIDTEICPGNVISIITSNANIITGPTINQTIQTCINTNVVTPSGGENYIIDPDTHRVAVPVSFTINDGSTIIGIEVHLMSDYTGDTWDFHAVKDQARNSDGSLITFDLDTFRYGGSLLCYFSTTEEIDHAGIRISVDKGGGFVEYVYNLCTFSVSFTNDVSKLYGMAPIKENSLSRLKIKDYTIFNASQFQYGIYDLYFKFDISAGNCYINLQLYSSDLSGGYSDSDIIASWQDILDGIFVISPSTNFTPPDVGDILLVDYGGGSSNNMQMVNQTPASSFTALFKRTIIINAQSEAHIHARITNNASRDINGFSVFAVPVFSHTTGYFFVGDCANAVTPNVKNVILIPI